MKKRRNISHRAPLMLLSVLTFMGLTFLGLAPALEAKAAGRAGDGMEELGSCLTSTGHGSVLVLMDQSGSLRDTDPQKARVEAGEYLVERLADYVSKTGVSLDVRVAGFAADYLPIGGWVTLDDATLSEVTGQIRAAGDVIYDYDTDYWLAFEGARQDLVDHDDSKDACRAIALFTDGDYDVDARLTSAAQKQFGTEKPYAPGHKITSHESADEVTEIGKQDICRAAGVADQLRAAHIILLGVALSVEDTDWPYLRSVILGGGSNAEANGVDSCGELSSPPGTFVAANDIDSLYVAFDAISAPGETLLSETVQVCQGAVCADGEARFVLDRTLQSVHLMSSTDVSDLEVLLFAPGSKEPAKLKPQGEYPSEETEVLDGVTYRWLTERTMQIDLDSAAGGPWDGIWRVAYVDAEASSRGEEVSVNISMSSPMVLEWTNLGDTVLRAGSETEPAQLRILDRVGGEPIDLSELEGGFLASVSLEDASGNTEKLFETKDPADLTSDVEMKVGDVALGKGVVTTSLELTTSTMTAEDGEEVGPTVLVPSRVEKTASVAAPLNFPTVGEDANFGLLDGALEANTSVPVSGPGCVWLEPSQIHLVASPSGAGEVSVTSKANSQDTCLKLEEGQEGELPLELSIEGTANGQVAGTVSVALASLDALDAPREASVEFEADMRKPLDVGVAWLTFALVFTVGVGLPLLVLYLLKARAAVFTPRHLTTGVTTARLPKGGHGEAEVSIDTSQMTTMPINKGTRRVDVDGRYLFKTVMGWLPTSMPRAELVSAAAPSVSGANPGARKGRAQVSLGLADQWVAVLDQPVGPDTVTVIVFAGSNDPEDVGRVLERARRELPAAVESVADFTKMESPEPPQESAQAASPEVFGSGPPPPAFGSEPPLGQQPKSPFG